MGRVVLELAESGWLARGISPRDPTLIPAPDQQFYYDSEVGAWRSVESSAAPDMEFRLIVASAEGDPEAGGSVTVTGVEIFSTASSKPVLMGSLRLAEDDEFARHYFESALLGENLGLDGPVWTMRPGFGLAQALHKGEFLITGRDTADVFAIDDRAILDWIGEIDGTGFEVNAGRGNDTIFGTRHSDIIRGEAGNDYISGKHRDSFWPVFPAREYGGDTLYGGMGNDTLRGRSRNDLLFGGAGNDWLLAEGNPELHGGAGDDTFEFGGRGSARAYGGDGADTFRFFSSNTRQINTLFGFDADEDVLVFGNFWPKGVTLTHEGGDTVITRNKLSIIIADQTLELDDLTIQNGW